MSIGSRNMFCVRLKELRKELNYSTKEFAEFLDIKPSSYYAYENGRSVPSFDGLMSIAEKCNVSLDWLCGRTATCKHITNNVEIASVLTKLLVANELGKQIDVQISFEGIRL